MIVSRGHTPLSELQDENAATTANAVSEVRKNDFIILYRIGLLLILFYLYLVLFIPAT